MSRPWNKSLSLFIGTQQLSATLRPPWWQRRAWARSLNATHVSSEVDLTLPLGQAIEAMFAKLQQQADISRAELHITLANAYGHFDVVEGDYANYSDQELQAIALGCVAELMGDAATDQAVRWQLQPDHKHLLLCALTQSLLDSVQLAALGPQLQLASIQPAFCRHWNQHLGAFPYGNGVFCVSDEGHSLVSCVQQGSITALSYGAGPALDLRTNRLLASMSSTDADPSYVLVTRTPPEQLLDARWTLCDWQEAVQ